jgi:hypothetical protein
MAEDSFKSISASFPFQFEASALQSRPYPVEDSEAASLLAKVATSTGDDPHILIQVRCMIEERVAGKQESRPLPVGFLGEPGRRAPESTITRAALPRELAQSSAPRC